MSRDKQPRTKADDLKKLFGLPPHDGPSNICLNDSYFALDITRFWGKSVEELSHETGIHPKR